MPAEGFISGLLGGLVGGTADTMYAEHERQIQQDLLRRKFLVDAISQMASRPDFRPEFFPIALEHIDELFKTQPGKGKKTEGKMTEIVKHFGSMMQPQVPQERMREVDPTGRRTRTAGQEAAAPGQFPRGFTPVPGVDPMFKPPEEMAAEKLLTQSAIAQRQQAHDQRVREATENRNVSQLAAAFKARDPELTDDAARAMAGSQIVQAQQDKHKDFELRARNIESQVATRKQNVDRANRLADSLIQHRKFVEQVTPLKATIATADRDVSAAESRIRSLLVRRAALLQAATAATDEKIKANVAEQVRQLDTELESAYQAHQNAIDAVQNAANQIDQLSGRALSPPPTTTSPVDAAMKRYADKYFGGDVERAKRYAAEHP